MSRQNERSVLSGGGKQARTNTNALQAKQRHDQEKHGQQ
jgi:hypothetical protein